MRIDVLVAALLSAVGVGGGVYVILLGCASAPAGPPPKHFHPVDRVQIGTPGLVIYGEEGFQGQVRSHGFTLREGEISQTPFQSNECPNHPTTDTIDTANNQGGRPVRVKHPSRAEALYGLLSFCPVEDGAKGPASRIHRIEVPQSYVDATAGGAVSVVFRPIEGSENPGWILFLSQIPVPGVEYDPSFTVPAGDRGVATAASGSADPAQAAQADAVAQGGGSSGGEDLPSAGIHAQIATAPDGVGVVSVPKTGPAYAAGLRAGDIIVAIDGTWAAGKPGPEVINLLRGEAGTTVELLIKRNDATQTITVTRAAIP